MKGLPGRGRASVSVACAIVVVCPAVVGADGPRRGSGEGLLGVMTGEEAELRETVAITRAKGAGEKAVLSLRLPRVKSADHLRFNGEVTVTNTCVDSSARCIGRRYRYDPRLWAQIVLARGRADAGNGTLPVSGRVGLSCEQTRPNRNHHCPLVISDQIAIEQPGQLPCPPAKCRLNMVVGAHHARARAGQVVVIGADRPNGSVEGGKARLSAAVERASGTVKAVRKATARRRVRGLPASFNGGQRVVYSQRLGDVGKGDVLLVRARQRTRIRELPYFLGTKIVVATKPDAVTPGPFSRRVVSREGTATETNGFNCTPGPSAFRSPCVTRKAGLAVIERRTSSGGEGPRPLYVNLVARTFPKLAQAGRGSYPPARVLPGGGLVVTHLHVAE